MRIVHSPERVMPSIAVWAIVQWSGGMNFKHLEAMKLFSAVAVLAITSTTLMTASQARARPLLYVDTFTHGQTHQKCIAGAKRVLEKNGFADFEEEEMSKQRVSEITGDHSKEPLTAAIKCDQKLGTTTFAVSGLDSELTYKMYGILYDAKW